MSKRVVFTFDERSLDVLATLRDVGRYPSLAEAVRHSLVLARGIQSQMQQGFSEVIVRNPDTGERRTLVLPVLWK